LETLLVKISISGIRGIFGDDLTLKDVLTYSRSFARLTEKDSCVIARDTRPSSRIMSETASAALMEQSMNVYNLGIAPTPFAFREARKYGAGLIITASHNPLEWNGLKFIIDGRGIFEDELRKLSEAQPNSQKIGNESSITSNYAEELARIVNVKGSPKIAVDAAGGAASNYTSMILSRIGCNVSSINDTYGRSSRAPDPTSDELTDLKHLVVNSKCEAGFAFDLDGDRLVFIDKSGRKMDPDTTLLLCIAKSMEMSIKSIVVSVDTSNSIRELALQNNCRIAYSKVGEANVVSMMMKERAPIGGEGSSGGFIMGEFNMCRDGILASAMISSMLKSDKFEDCMQIASKYHLKRGKISIDSTMHLSILDELVEYMEHECSSVDTTDGVKGVIDDAWVLIRGSNTEHSMRLSVESAQEERTQKLYEEYEGRIREAYEKVKRVSDN
jgi:phosphomannomutase